MMNLFGIGFTINFKKEEQSKNEKVTKMQRFKEKDLHLCNSEQKHEFLIVIN